MKLRMETERLGLGAEFDLRGETLTTSRWIPCDLIQFLEAPKCSLIDLGRAVEPVAKTWSYENWRAESDRVAAALVQVLEANTKTFDGSVYVDLLKKAVHSHPTSTPLFELLVRRLESLNRIDERTRRLLRWRTPG
jgi:hypothetical protein